MWLLVAAEIIHVRVGVIEIVHIIGECTRRIGKDDKYGIVRHHLPECCAAARMKRSRKIILRKIVFFLGRRRGLRKKKNIYNQESGNKQECSVEAGVHKKGD